MEVHAGREIDDYEIYICMPVCVCLYTHLYIYICVCMYTYRHVYICFYICVYIHVYIYTCICGSIYIHIYMCTYTHTHNCTLTFIYTQFLVNVCVFVQIQSRDLCYMHGICTHESTHTHPRTHVNTYVCL